MSLPRVGVLAVQGDYEAHRASLRRLGIDGRQVRTPGELDAIDALILPGGESGAHIRILKENGLWEALRAFHDRGGALWGTCAGLILLARGVTEPVQESLDLIDIDVIRNGWGRQIDSFETDLPWSAWGEEAGVLSAVAPGVAPRGELRADVPGKVPGELPSDMSAELPETLRLVFIRAPRISRVGPGVTPLLRLGDEVIAARQGRVLVTTFHPEMTAEPTIHRWFLEQVVADAGSSVSSRAISSPIAR